MRFCAGGGAAQQGICGQTDRLLRCEGPGGFPSPAHFSGMRAAVSSGRANSTASRISPAIAALPREALRKAARGAWSLSPPWCALQTGGMAAPGGNFRVRSDAKLQTRVNLIQPLHGAVPAHRACQALHPTSPHRSHRTQVGNVLPQRYACNRTNVALDSYSTGKPRVFDFPGRRGLKVFNLCVSKHRLRPHYRCEIPSYKSATIKRWNGVDTETITQQPI